MGREAGKFRADKKESQEKAAASGKKSTWASSILQN